MEGAHAFVGFVLDERRYALPAAAVERVVRAVAATPLPGAPDVVAGAINVGGKVIPLFDVRRRFGLKERAVAPGDQFIIARAAGHCLAIAADAVEPVREYTAADVVAADAVLPDLPYFRGVVKLADGLLLIQDLERFLSPDETVRLAAALEGAGHG